MPKHSISQRITFNIQNGLKYRASIQLASLIHKSPNDLELRNELANLYYEAGFLDAAGKFWILNGSKESHIRKCVEIYEKSLKYSGYTILQDIKFTGNISKLDPYAQNKILELEADSLSKVNHIPNFSTPKSDQFTSEPLKKSNLIVEKIGCAVGIVILIFCLISLFIGVQTIFDYFF